MSLLQLQKGELKHSEQLRGHLTRQALLWDTPPAPKLHPRVLQNVWRAEETVLVAKKVRK